jgi:hypothetical protein
VKFRWAYLKRVLAGSIFGLYMAHLLYFLNPQVNVTAGRLVTVTIVYGLTCGLLFGSALWGLRALRVRLFGRPDEGHYRAHGFGYITLAAFIASVIYWIHLTTVRIYLPPGAVRILSKATNVITATAFVLLALWFFERGADRRRSRIIFGITAAVIALSSFFLYQRRESYRTAERGVVVANVGTVAGQRPVMLVVIRNLPYDWLVTLGSEGGLPFFDHAMSRGYFSRIEPFPTTSPKALWASLATGKLPYRHGVTGRFAYRTPLNGSDPDERFLLIPSGVGFAAWGLVPPVQRISAPLPSGDSLPVWRLFERLSLRSDVIGWPAVKRGDAGVVVTDAMLAVSRPSPATLQRLGGSAAGRDVAAKNIEADLAALDAAGHAPAGTELTVAWLEGFARTQLAAHVYSNQLDAGDTAKGAVMRAYIQELDRALDALAREHPDHLMFICSPAAVTPPDVPATAFEFARQRLRGGIAGAEDGFLLISGPGVAHLERTDPAYVTDLVPTILFAAGLPVGRDMDGAVISRAFDEAFLRDRLLTAIPTYEAERLVVRRTNVVR